MRLNRWILIAGSLLLPLLPVTSWGQSVDVGGRAYVDYFYRVTNPEPSTEGLHGFQYRRLYLTTDFTLAEDVSGRARLEANDGTVTSKGPVPVVKDLSLTWTYTGEHSMTFGVTPPPAFGIAEDVWGYRSLEKTIMDLQDVVESRDFGLRLDGPVTEDGSVQYAVMYANNSDQLPEMDKYKRVYGQLRVNPTERMTLVGGADYAGYGDPRDHGIRISTFAGYALERLRAGFEGYWYQLTFTSGGVTTDLGGSLFCRYKVSSNWELIARLDRSRMTVRSGLTLDERRTIGGADDEQLETTVVGGLAYQPYDNVKFIPNVRVRDPSQARATTTLRATAEIHF